MSDPLRLHPDNPARFLWRGKATFLLGSTEHYGAVLNAAFDYERYLDTIAADGLNLTRVFAFFREREDSLGGQLGYANTLAPRPEHYLAPWARIADPENKAADGLPKFDLNTWDERYFTRLRSFLRAAAVRGVVVELVLFCNQYGDDLWRYSPLHPANNVNDVGAGIAVVSDFLSLADPSVVEYQRRFVRQVVAAVNDFDNVYFELCNEPTYYRTPGSRPEPLRIHNWQRVLLQTLRETERTLPKRHLVAVNPHMNLPVREDASGLRVAMLDDGFYRHDPEIDVLNVHYISQRTPREGLHYTSGHFTRDRNLYRFGNIAAFVTLRSGSGKPISFDEDFTGLVHNVTPIPTQNRLEAWESFIGGCAAYDHLDFTFTPSDPTGSARGDLPAVLPRAWFDGRPLRRQFSYLAAYAVERDLASLRPDLLMVQQSPDHTGAIAARSIEDAREVAVYLADTRTFDAGFGTSALEGGLYLGGLPSGSRYAGRSLNPRTGAWTKLPDLAADANGNLRVDVPPFDEDLLLHLDRIG